MVPKSVPFLDHYLHPASAASAPSPPVPSRASPRPPGSGTAPRARAARSARPPGSRRRGFPGPGSSRPLHGFRVSVVVPHSQREKVNFSQLDLVSAKPFCVQVPVWTFDVKVPFENNRNTAAPGTGRREAAPGAHVGDGHEPRLHVFFVSSRAAPATSDRDDAAPPEGERTVVLRVRRSVGESR